MKTSFAFVFAMTCLAGTVVEAETIVHVSTPAELVTAISTVPDGGVIELASGTYTAPASGFSILNPAKTFTIRAETSGGAILDGGGTRRVLTYQATSAAQRGWVNFEGIVFRNGFSSENIWAGGLTLVNAFSTFIACEFRNNASSVASGGTGGGTGVRSTSWASFIGCTWADNTAKTQGAGMVASTDSTILVHACQFLRNRTDLPNHYITANAGGLVVNQSVARITNTYFAENRAGFAGGAINAKSSWSDPLTEVTIANCSFVDNAAIPDPSVTTQSPSEGGALHVEDLATVTIYNSRFEGNEAQFGGALSCHRCLGNVNSSVFRGNNAVGTTTSGGRGGAIKISSNDTSVDGSVNRRSAAVQIQDSLFQGRYLTTGAAAQVGGCVYVAGDTNRMYGQGGVSQQGGLAENRATLGATGSVFVDCDVDDFVPSTAVLGGAIFGSLAALDLADSLVMDSDALASGSSGGAGAFMTESYVGVAGTTFAANSAVLSGGGIYVSGSEASIDGCYFVKNEVSPGVSEPATQSYGAALYSSPYEASGFDVTGLVENSAFSLNVGLDIYDSDRLAAAGVINGVQYNGNDFYNTTFGGSVYIDSVAGGALNPVGLNNLVVDRGGGNTTDKSPLNNNAAFGSLPIFGTLLGVPTQIINAVASGEPASSTASYLAYAWSGASATLDGQPVAGNRGLTEGDVGSHHLVVGTQTFSDTIEQGPVPQASLVADPVAIASGEQSELIWATSSGTFLDSALDWGANTGGAASGSVWVSPPDTRTYHLVVVTQQGGDSAFATVYVDEQPPDDIFADGFESGDTSAWSFTQE